MNVMTNHVEMVNGAEHIARTPTHVLAKYRGEFVTWQYSINPKGQLETYWGHYFKDNQLLDAIDNLRERSVPMPYAEHA